MKVVGGCDSFQMFFHVEHELEHPLEELRRGLAPEVLEDQLLHEQSRDVSQLQGTCSRRMHEVAMSIVDDDEISTQIIARTPQLTGRLVEGVAR